ncbi:MAG: hypothetical protein U0Z17_09395 [Bacteroidales bacterium]
MIESLQLKGQELVETISSVGISAGFAVVESNDDEDTLVPAILDYAVKQEDIDLILILTQQEIGIVEYFVDPTPRNLSACRPYPLCPLSPKPTGVSPFFHNPASKPDYACRNNNHWRRTAYRAGN